MDFFTRTCATPGLVRVALLLCLASACLAVPARAATGADELNAAVEELRLLVTELGERETPPDQEELDALKGVAVRVTAALDARRSDDDVATLTSEEVKDARRLLNATAALLLLPAAAALRARTQQLSDREQPVTEQDLETLRPSAAALLASIDGVVTRLDPERTGKPRGVRKAREALQGFDLLEVTVATATLVAEELRLEQLTPAPSLPDLDPCARIAAALQNLLEQGQFGEERADGDPTKKTLDDARAAVARARTLVLLPLVERYRPGVEEVEARRSSLTEADLARIEQLGEELAQQIEEVRPGTLEHYDRAAPPAVARARAMLRRIVSLELQPYIKRGEEILADLEHRAELPTEEELAPLRESAAELGAALQGFSEKPVSESPDAEPDMVRRGRELLWRFALIDLRRSVADMGPFVGALEKQKEDPTPEQLEELQGLAETTQVKLRMSRGKDEAELPAEEKAESTPQVVTEARDLMRRADALRPDTVGSSEDQRDAPVTQPFLRKFRFYGSLRLRTFLSSDGFSRIDDESSRIGVRGRVKMSKKVTFYGQLEVAINPLTTLSELPDLGSGGTDLDDLRALFPLRLAYLGFESSYGDLRLGKQWSAYWDVSVFSDQLPAYTGTTSGAFNIGDGSVSGTGRPDQLIQYRGASSSFSYAGQIQARNLTENDQPVVDTYGGSVSYARSDGIDLGVAFSVVRDGVNDPEPDQPMRGDWALILGARTKNEKRYAGATVTVSQNHEQDDQGQFFDSIGFESYADYLMFKKLRWRLALNGQLPVGSYSGDYRLAYLVLGASYDILPGFRVFALPRFSFSRNADGSDRGGWTVAMILMYTF
jgi:predicted porin